MREKRIVNVFQILFLLLVMFVFLFPSYTALLTSWKTRIEVSRSALSFPETFAIQNYIEAIRKSQFLTALKNSCAITFPSVLLIVICSSMGGYSIARHSAKHKIFKYLDRLYVSSLMIPFQILMIPVYRMYKSLRLLNTLQGMVLMLTGVSIAYATFLYVGFVKSIPRELEEAALIDGCGPYKAFFVIVFPMLKPITTTVAALHVMWLWNDFNISLVLMQKESVRPLTVKQYYFFGQYASDYGMAFAAAILTMLPVVIFFMAAQKYLVEGISGGAVKG